LQDLIAYYGGLVRKLRQFPQDCRSFARCLWSQPVQGILHREVVMRAMLQLVPIFLYALVGIIALVMAGKSIFCRRFLPFHQAAAEKRWEEIDRGLQCVLLALLRVSGLGFLVVGVLLTTFPVAIHFHPNLFVKYAAPMLSLLYCLGLFLVNFRLHSATKALTPWRGSLAATTVLLVGIVMSIAG
jgi:hypothetical protein